MRLIADYHIHSKFSRFFHGKDSIQDLVNAANSLGLQEIAITDHGFRHLFRTNKQNLAKARKIIDEINETSSVKVLLGMEADIVAEDGTIDVDNETLAMIDILIVGYHKMIKTDFTGYFGSDDESPETVQRNTNAYLNAIERYPVGIISHLNHGVKVDVKQIADLCAKENVFIEINNRHLCFSEKDTQALIDSDCLLVVNSDAHNRDDVGNVSVAFDYIKKHKFKTENFVNIKFDYDEMSDDDRELEAYYAIYRAKVNRKNMIEAQNEERKLHEFTNTLSPELEDQLKQIAHEKGFIYTKNIVPDDTFDLDMDIGVDAEAEEVLEQARQYIAEKEEAEQKATKESEEAEQAAPKMETDNEKAEEIISVSDGEELQNEQPTQEKAEKTAEVKENDGDDFRFNMGLKDAKAVKMGNKGLKVQKNTKTETPEKSTKDKRKGKVLV